MWCGVVGLGLSLPSAYSKQQVVGARSGGMDASEVVWEVGVEGGGDADGDSDADDVGGDGSEETTEAHGFAEGDRRRLLPSHSPSASSSSTATASAAPSSTRMLDRHTVSPAPPARALSDRPAFHLGPFTPSPSSSSVVIRVALFTATTSIERRQCSTAQTAPTSGGCPRAG